MGSNILLKSLWYICFTLFFSVLICIICWKGPLLKNKTKKVRFIILETLLCDLSIIACPVVFHYCKGIKPENEILILLIEGTSAYILFFTLNVLPTLFKNILIRIPKLKTKIKFKSQKIDQKYVYLIYNTTLLCSFVILILFYKKEATGNEEDIYDYLAYTFAPLLILIGNIFPLECVCSPDSFFEYISELKKIKNEFFLNSRKIIKTIFWTVLVNIIIGAFFLLPILEPIVDSIWIPCLLGTTISLFIIKSSI